MQTCFVWCLPDPTTASKRAADAWQTLRRFEGRLPMLLLFHLSRERDTRAQMRRREPSGTLHALCEAVLPRAMSADAESRKHVVASAPLAALCLQLLQLTRGNLGGARILVQIPVFLAIRVRGPSHDGIHTIQWC